MAKAETNPQPRLHLAEARISLKLSQQELADRIGTTDVNISRWERGLTRPGPYFRRKLCAIFGKSEAELELEATEKWVAAKMATLQDEPTTVTTSAMVAANAIYDPFIPRPTAISLVGRGRELAQLRGQLLEQHEGNRGNGESVALTALNGLPGVGKTALAIALAHDGGVRRHFSDGILWAGLGPKPNSSGLLSHWERVLKIPEADMATEMSNEARARTLRGVIGGRRLLLVIDDAWKIEDALLFKVGGPNCAHLVTTRFPTLAAQFAPGAGGAVSVKELEKEQSIELLRLLAPDVMQREGQKAQELINTVGGLPLALTVIGNYLRVQASTGSSRRIQTALHRLSSAEERLKLSEPQAPSDAHSSLKKDAHLSLETVFAVSEQYFEEQQRKAFYALAVFPAKPNSFSEQAALAVAACTADTLDVLSGMGLLESSADDRYTLHQTIADYARMQLGDDHGPHKRLMQYVMDYVEGHKKEYEVLERGSTNILATLEMAHEQGQTMHLIRIALAFAPYLLSRGLYTLARQHLQRAYEAAQAQNDSHNITNILLFLGRIARKQGEYAQATEYLQKGLDIARKNDDQEAICSLLTDLGGVTGRQGKYNQTEAYLQEGLTIARMLAYDWRICSILGRLGSIASIKGNYVEAEVYLQEGLAIARQIEDREQTCSMLVILGTTLGEQGKHTQAEIYFKEGLELAKKIGHKEWMSGLLNNLGDLASERGDYTHAEKYFQEGLTIVRQSNHRELTSVLLISLGLTTRKQGHYKQAEKYLQEGLTLARKIGVPQITANGLYEYGHVFLEQLMLEKAEKTFQEMLSITPEGSQDLIALAKYGLARTFGAYGNTSEAYRLGEASAITLEKMGHRGTGEVRRWLASLPNG